MFDVVTDIPKTDELRIEIHLDTRVTTAGVPDLAPLELRAPGLAEMWAQPSQLVGLGLGLAYLERVAPTGCEGTPIASR